MPQQTNRTNNCWTVAIDEIDKCGALKELDEKKMVDLANEIGKDMKKIKTAQLRRFFDEMKRIESSYDKSSVQMLRPRLAYAAGREKDRNKQSILKAFFDIIEASISKIKGEEDFKKLVKFVEAILAYHKFHGGSD